MAEDCVSILDDQQDTGVTKRNKLPCHLRRFTRQEFLSKSAPDVYWHAGGLFIQLKPSTAQDPA